MAINLPDLIVPSSIGATTGMLIVFLVLKNLSLGLKLKLAGGGFATAMVVAALYYAFQNIIFGVVIGTLWAFGWLVIIADQYSKTMKDFEPLENPLKMTANTVASMSAMMLTIIVFILGSAATIFPQSSSKFSLVAFSAPPLIGAISFIMCSYFTTKFELETEPYAKQQSLKKVVAWWTIGQTILISTIVSVSFFVAFVVETIVA
ncbi:MAG: hypothetical protein V1836_02515 [Candidatus Aenigmatarchaeota archaeon]